MVKRVLLVLAFVFTVAASAPAVDREAASPRVARVQTGYATFLARSFHGDESASGEIFDRRKLVAAHRSCLLYTSPSPRD